MNKFNIAQAKRQTGLSYIGGVSLSSKMEKSENYNELIYVIYLAPAKLSGYNVCPQASSHCIAACLHESGQNRMDIHENRINKARIKKTKPASKPMPMRGERTAKNMAKKAKK